MGGCACVGNKNKISIESNLVQGKEAIVKGRRRSLFYTIPFSTWALIVDFLKYKEVKEVAKVNRSLNSISRSHNILIKFYQNKRDSDSRNTGRLFLKLQKTLHCEETDIRPNIEKLYLKENSLSQKKKLNEIKNGAYNTKYSNVSKTLNLDKISVGSFKELQNEKKAKPKIDNSKVDTTKSKFTVKFKGSLKDKEIDKPKVFCEDYNNLRTSLLISKSLKDNCSDNLTPSFKESSENNPDFISNIGDPYSQKNIIAGFNNNYINNNFKKSQEFVLRDFNLIGGFEREKEFSNSEDISLNTLGNEDRILQEAKKIKVEDKNLNKSHISPSTWNTSLEHTNNLKSLTSHISKKQIK